MAMARGQLHGQPAKALQTRAAKPAGATKLLGMNEKKAGIPTCASNGICQHFSIREAEVNALPRQRVDAVGCIPNQRQPR
jgi:hypothetical protein